jgi:hypothetical protein
MPSRTLVLQKYLVASNNNGDTNAEIKFYLCMPWRHTVEWRYSSTHALAQHFMGVSDQFHSPAALPWAPDPVLTFLKTEKSLDPAGNQTMIPPLTSP